MAEDDLRDLAEYVGTELQSLQGAKKLIEGIRAKCELVASNPNMGERRPELGEHIRTVLAGTHANPRNFVVVYRPISDGIEVVRIFRTSRDYPRLF